MKKIYLKILILLSLTFPLSISAISLKCSDSQFKSGECAQSCQGIGIPCNENSFCGGMCGTNQDCCCSLTPNSQEIPVGRLIDRTEYLSDKIIEWSNKEIEEAQKLIEDAQLAYSLVNQCNADNCGGGCSNQNTCTGCDSAGCSAGKNNVPDDPSCSDAKTNELKCCTPTPPQSGIAPQKKITTYGALNSSGYNCLPEKPKNVQVRTNGLSVDLSWDEGVYRCENSCSGTCFPEPRYKIVSTDNTISTLWFSGTSRTIHFNSAGTYSLRILETTDGVDFSSTDLFPVTVEESVKPGVPLSLTTYHYYGTSACTVLFDWEPNCAENNNICQDNVKFQFVYRKSGGGQVNDLGWSRISNKIVKLYEEGEYDWRVRQDVDSQQSDWATGHLNFEANPPSHPEITNIDAGEHFLTVSWTAPVKNGCGECTCNDCTTNGAAKFKIKKAGTNTTLKESDWISDPTYTFDNLYSGTEYEVEGIYKNGCNKESIYWGSGKATTLCTGGNCEVQKVCSPDQVVSSKECSQPNSNVCVPSGQCALNNGHKLDKTACSPYCDSGKECCSLSNICVQSEQQCSNLGGKIYTKDDYCNGRCTELTSVRGKDYSCCVGVNEELPQSQSCSAAQYSSNQPSCCCDSSYTMCQPLGCTGNACPQGAREALQRISRYLGNILDDKENIEKFYLQMENNVPNELSTVRKKLAKCFRESGTQKAAERGETSLPELVDCQEIIRNQEDIASFLPDKKGNAKAYAESACYGQDYCQVKNNSNEGGDLPFPSPCAEDFYCCTWQEE